MDQVCFPMCLCLIFKFCIALLLKQCFNSIVIALCPSALCWQQNLRVVMFWSVLFTLQCHWRWLLSKSYTYSLHWVSMCSVRHCIVWWSLSHARDKYWYKGYVWVVAYSSSLWRGFVVDLVHTCSLLQASNANTNWPIFDTHNLVIIFVIVLWVDFKNFHCFTIYNL